ncbi:MAG TPA: xanthine dehydrogenase family protein molybdopterin-binding subunit [Steroidobacteraceae bacterium]|nr:xanthine dehydrogenase family protein molybdopterin-binding subunit [Steroidobacteraceae bacterium]
MRALFDTAVAEPYRVAMPNLKRRYVILGTAGAVGALMIGWAATPQRRRLMTDKPLALSQGQVALNGWVKVSSDNTVTVMMSQAEMGQGAQTGLAMLLAEEMDADWTQVTLEQSTLDAIYNNQAVIIDGLPFQPNDHGIVKRATGHVLGKIIRAVPGLQGTGGSSSVADQWLPLREAGASARALLIGAAAALWRVPAGECRAENGRVLHPSGKSAAFGELAQRAAQLPLPKEVTLKTSAQFKLIGHPVRRIDNAAKLDGSATYGIDVLLPGLLYASISMCPTVGGKVAGFDAAAAQAMPGVRKVVKLEPAKASSIMPGSTCGGVAVIADTPFRAMRALRQVAIEWDHGAAAALSSETISSDLRAALDGKDGTVHFHTGSVADAFKSAAKTIEAEYRVPFLAHATMEPMNCTAQFKDGAATVWAPTQAAGFASGAVAKALGISASKVDIKVPYLGGGFGRRYLSDFIVQAALLARETQGAPVQLLWPREQDMAHDYYRPTYLCRCKAGFDANGKLIAWQTTSAGSSMGAPSFIDMSTDGASNTAYAFANARVAHVTVETAVPVGIWRSVAHSQNAFFIESFIDECAAASGKDPVAFRTELLSADERHRRVLSRAAELANWQQPLAAAPDGAKQGRGIAIHRSFGSVVAQIAEVSLGEQRQIRVHRVICVVDCGVAVNPNLIRQQMEGGIVFGLSAALRGEITIEKGQVQQSNFNDYAPLRINECPAIQVEIMQSVEAPSGVGEPGTPPIAPAVANALFALTGVRLRSLPLKIA